VASVSNDKGGSRRILFTDPDGRRKAIRLGRMNRRTAEQVKAHVEKLVEARLSASAVDPATATWIGGLPGVLRRRLERAGLVEPDARKAVPTVGEWLDAYAASRTDVSRSSQLNYGMARASLVGYFGEGKRLDEVSVGDAEDFHRHLLATLAAATANRRTKYARQFWSAAVRRKIIAENPFKGIQCGNVANDARKYHVSMNEFKAVLAVCPSPEWRAAWALGRIGGLRIPSELRGLRWGDILWGKDRFRVQSPKTKSERMVPLFPQLRDVLLEAFEAAEEGQEYVCPRLRLQPNLRTHLLRLIHRAGLTAWERPWQNCRASRETELLEEFPLQTVTTWIGNSVAVAAKHYLAPLEQHWEKAARNPAQHTAAQARMDSPEDADRAEKEGDFACVRDDATHCETAMYAREDSNASGAISPLSTSDARTSDDSCESGSAAGGAESGAQSARTGGIHGEAGEVVTAWPFLPEHVRSEILRLVRAERQSAEE